MRNGIAMSQKNNNDINYFLVLIDALIYRGKNELFYYLKIS